MLRRILRSHLESLGKNVAVKGPLQCTGHTSAVDQHPHEPDEEFEAERQEMSAQHHKAS